jgi:hypothetical protein
MRKLLLAGAALLTLGVATPTYAATLLHSDEEAGAVVGGTAGGVTGGTIGFLVGGPVGAVIGGVTGSVIGAQAGISASSVEFVQLHPVDSLVIDGRVHVGARLGDDVKIHSITGDKVHGYVYLNDRPVIVDRDSRTVVWVD